MTGYTRTIQELFNIVIDAGHYWYEIHHRPYYNERLKKLMPASDDAMCIAANHAFKAGIITGDELNKIKNACREYVKSLSFTYYDGESYSFLEYALYGCYLPSDFHARLAIYRDWANRPKAEDIKAKLAKMDQERKI